MAWFACRRLLSMARPPARWCHKATACSLFPGTSAGWSRGSSPARASNEKITSSFARLYGGLRIALLLLAGDARPARGHERGATDRVVACRSGYAGGAAHAAAGGAQHPRIRLAATCAAPERQLLLV